MLGCIDRGGANKVTSGKNYADCNHCYRIYDWQSISFTLLCAVLMAAMLSCKNIWKINSWGREAAFYGLFRFCFVCLYPKTCNAFLNPAYSIFIRDNGENFLYTVALDEIAFSLNFSYFDLNSCSVPFDQTLVGGLSYFLCFSAVFCSLIFFPKEINYVPHCTLSCFHVEFNFLFCYSNLL